MNPSFTVDDLHQWLAQLESAKIIANMTQPILTEKEEQGIYTATLEGYTENGSKIGTKFELDMVKIREAALPKLITLKLSLKAIDAEIEHLISNQKKDGLSVLYSRYNEKLSSLTY